MYDKSFPSLEGVIHIPSPLETLFPNPSFCIYRALLPESHTQQLLSEAMIIHPEIFQEPKWSKGVQKGSQIRRLKSQIPPSIYKTHRYKGLRLRDNLTKEKMWLQVLKSILEIKPQKVIQKNPVQRQAGFRFHEQATREMIMTDIMNAQTGTASFSVDFSPSGRQASVHTQS